MLKHLNLIILVNYNIFLNNVRPNFYPLEVNKRNLYISTVLYFSLVIYLRFTYNSLIYSYIYYSKK